MDDKTRIHQILTSSFTIFTWNNKLLLEIDKRDGIFFLRIYIISLYAQTKR